MSKNQKIRYIIEGAVLVVLGVLLAVFGGESVLDLTFGILCLVGGVAFGVLTVLALSKKEPLPFGSLLGFCALVSVGICFLVEFLTVAALIAFIMILLIALGGALVLYGVYSLIKGLVVSGIFQLIIGAALAVLAGLYIGVADFHEAFWIIIGIVVALYGVLCIVTPFLPNKKKA